MVVATERFHELARQSAEREGLPDARMVVVAHPVGGVSREELESRADAVTADVIERLLRGS